MKYSLQECDLFFEKKNWAVIAAVEEDGRIVGSCYLDNWKDQTPFLRSLFVNPQHRLKGVGSQIVRVALYESAARGKRSVSMWVHETNLHAIRIYRNLGFEQFFIDDNQWFMSRLLTPSDANGALARPSTDEADFDSGFQCRFPGECVRVGPHSPSECHTQEMIQADERQLLGGHQ